MKRLSFSNLILVLGLLFIYLPMVLLVIYSFNASRLVTVWGGWSLKWYAGLLDNSQLMGAVMRSLEIALYTAVAAVADSQFPWAYAVWWLGHGAAGHA
jgi:putrescine transport system permease protein